MPNTSFIHSVVRFVKEHNYSDSLFSKSFLEYISRHYKDCFINKSIVVSQEQKMAKNKSIEVGQVTVSERQSLTHVYISRTGDKQTITEFRESLKKYPNNEIVDKYNKIERLYGVHQQVLYLIAMNQEFILRFGKTPFQIEENCLVGLGRKILYIGNIYSFVFVDEN
ncbi:hypothetical protein H4K35_02465 [Myroides sp. NP-2]|uniref:hypothetical protein n=1 Tax=Myroides sp. NP-2 TaxID=2759945 RepID=UPI0015FA9BE6|nr:hypothetical protein [Myroides sp. NP-2]MBB1149002.1 hypothetical protein [Myroides sp. NP-2]